MLEEAGVAPASYRTLKWRLPAYADDAWRQRLSEACAAHARLGPASIQAGRQTITAADPLPEDLHHALDAINREN